MITRNEVLDRYRPIRADIRNVLRQATQQCSRADLQRAFKHVAPWAETEDLQNANAAEMLLDVALFEPNQRGRRAFDRFLAKQAGQLDAADRALAERMATAWFSLFRVAGREERAGIWLQDLLAEDRHLWLVDEGLEASAPDGLVLGMRLFDAGPFHAGFGIIVAPEEEILEVCLQAKARGNRLPVRHSLAARLYGDHLQPDIPPSLADLAMLGIVLEALAPKPRFVADAEPTRRARQRPEPAPRRGK